MKNLLNTALLGTAKQPTPDFFAQSALQHAQHIAGALPMPLGATFQRVASAPHDPTPVLPDAAARILAIWLAQKHDYLIEFAMKKMAKHGFRLPEKLLPQIPDKTFPDEIILGEFGKWLNAQIQPNQTIENSEENDWTLLPHAQRTAYLANLRQRNPHEMREQLSQIWKTAPANQRTDYIELFAENLSANDLDFLNAALKDRSQNVKDVARKWLFRLPESEIAQQNIRFLRERLSFQSNKWTQTEQPFTPEMKAAGIDELSPNKRESDSHYQLRQLIERMSLPMWCVFLDCDENQAVKILTNHYPIALHDEEWITKIDHVDFTYAVVSNGIFNASGKVFANKKHIPNHLTEHFVNLPDVYRENIFEKHGVELAIQGGYFWRNGEDFALFSGNYSAFVLFNIMKTQEYYYGYGLSSYADFTRLAASLANTPTVVQTIQKIAQSIQKDSFPYWKREHYQQLCEQFEQRVAFEMALQAA